MSSKRPKISLERPLEPRTGEIEKMFATEDDIEQASGLQLLAVRLDAIHPDPSQPRRSFPVESLEELRDSIRQDGVIQPIEVTETANNRYMIVHGERRWRAAVLAGLETVPAIVRRRDYDTITRFVRQMVENIQREDLNDIDRAAGLLRLRALLQEEIDSLKKDERPAPETPWSKTITWAKVGGRLGYSRQRIHQLIKLLELPEEIKDSVREGKLTERETRVYQGLTTRQQRDLHRLRMKEDFSSAELRRLAKLLKANSRTTVSQASKALKAGETGQGSAAGATGLAIEENRKPPLPSTKALRGESWSPESILPPRQGAPTNVDRLDYVRGHLARVQRKGLEAKERRELTRLLSLIKNDVDSLLSVLQEEKAAE